ncbi:DUF4388 domain-containing protein [Candidatus Viridilinea mediisalina]|uniref:PatA-like N-terminal domain-containing protein n=1 Tax=Candidatus Viridilinea mediisalina TaxID=2024553 RepID=A0A2A6RIQ4_9CHLR|nr:DUF4388 domain-containing protein [Candidatus Viridilinea mediisalina]PDW02765.1 hypothetical protein CJ255_12410 [Candidatus Viridilinea mediisalina]
MKLEGTIPLFPLHELIEMVVYSSVTGTLNVYGPGAPGTLYFRDGVLYHAERGSAEGMTALSELFEVTEAHFTFVSDVTTEAESLWGTLHEHLHTAQRLAARWRKLRAYIPHMDLIPLLLGSHEQLVHRVSPKHHTIFQALDQQSDLRQLAQKLGWAEIDVGEAIVQLCVDGLIELRPTRQTTAQVESPTDDQKSPRTGGLFDRIRSRTPPRPAPPPPAAAATTAPQSTPEEPASEPKEAESPDDLILKLLRG